MATKNNSEKMKPRTIWWGDKIHTSSAKPINAETYIEQHKAYQVEAKERPVLIIKETDTRHEGLRHFNVVNISSRSYEGSVSIEIKFRGGSSFLKPPMEETSENLLNRYECEIHEQDFRAYKRALIRLTMASFT